VTLVIQQQRWGGIVGSTTSGDPSSSSSIEARLSSVWSALAAAVPPIAIGIGFMLALLDLLQGSGVLGGWSTLYNERAGFVVESCAGQTGIVLDSVHCEGELLPESAPAAVRSTMNGTAAAFGVDVPRRGQRIEVYYRADDTSVAYPLEGRATELARFIIGLIPLLFIAGGTAGWLLGWAMTRRVAPEEAEAAPWRFAFPQRFALQGATVKWILVGLTWLLIDRWFIDKILGTVGIG